MQDLSLVGGKNSALGELSRMAKAIEGLKLLMVLQLLLKDGSIFLHLTGLLVLLQHKDECHS